MDTKKNSGFVVSLLPATGEAALSRNGYELSYDPRGRCFKVFLGMWMDVAQGIF